MSCTKKYTRVSSRKAFTLIEVLVASAVMVILVGIVSYIAGTIMNTWNRASGKLVANSEARLALELIAQDLEAAVLKKNGQQWLRVEELLSFAGTGAPHTPDAVALKLFAPVMDHQSGNDGICAIAYMLAYKESYSGGSNVYSLYRRVIDPQITLNDYLSSSFDDPSATNVPQGSLASTGKANANWNTTFSPTDTADIADNSNYLVGNVIDFKVLVYDDSGALLPRNGDANNNLVPGGDYIFGGSDSTAGTNIPIYADIILTVITDQGAGLLSSMEQGFIPNAASNVDAVVAQHGETLIRRVYFRSSPI